MNKVKLEHLLQDYDSKTDDLYSKLVVLDKEQTDFEPKSRLELAYISLYLFHMKYGIENISKRGIIPKLFGKVQSYEEFKSLLQQYKEMEYHHEHIT